MSLDLQRIRALCFDVDGTLSDTDDLYARRIAPLLPRFLFRDPAQTARRMVMWVEAPTNALLGLADQLGLDRPMTAVINSMNRQHTRALTAAAPLQPVRDFLLVPGVDEMLRRLKGRYPMAIISVRDEGTIMAFLEAFDLVQYFDTIITGLSAERTKPYPDPILLAAQRMDVRPEECLMIGDTTVDMRAGKAARAQTVGVLCGFGVRSELERLGADLILESTPDLEKILPK